MSPDFKPNDIERAAQAEWSERDAYRVREDESKPKFFSNKLDFSKGTMSVEYLIDVTSLQRVTGPAELALNDIGRVRLRTSKPLAFDSYARNRFTGSFILIDEATNDTVGAGMITGP